MAYVWLAIGGGMAVLPGVLDPLAPVNGLTLLGILVMFYGVVVAVRSR